ncbi:Mitochondrial distribution and morphology protein 12 [Emydomyces testavorans]|uniref:1-phosphatidylinositol-3-phosphate 5-kinase n=1 Tax=Emydomyces testavorans TaxID=2070801 RepID=A0AAF0IKF3_9EURO|nr:Mitochondrial distribution and morphology protein 12 [Emydomyces testavorans]
MASQRSQEASSPSASSIFLPLGRRSRRGSVASYSTQTERDNLNEALDQIHSAACHSDTLTVFNEFTNPPVTSPTADNKTGVVGDLQGGLSGLYSLLRASVGGVKDRVGIPTKALDSQSTGTAVSRSSQPLSSQLDVSGVGGVDNQPSPSNSAHTSKAHSPVLSTFSTQHESMTTFSAPKSSKLSSKAPSVSSKTSVPSSGVLKPSLTSLTKVSPSATVDPAVSEVNVNAVRPGPRDSSSNSGSLSASIITHTDSTASDRIDGSLQMSSLQSSQELGTNAPPRSPKLSTNEAHIPERRDRVAAGTLHSHVPLSCEKALSPTKAAMIDGKNELTEVDTAFPHSQWKGRQLELGHNVSHRTGNSTTSLLAEPSPVQTSMTNSLTKFSTGESSMNDTGPATVATSVSLTDREPSSRHSSRASLTKPREPLAPRISQCRLPGYGPSHIISSESSSGARSTTALPHISFDTLEPVGKSVARSARVSRDLNLPQSSIDAPFKRKLLSREYWMRDENAKDCFHCGEPFSTFRRKHHCRTCGQIFDSKCTCIISGTSFGHSGSVRVCKPCEAVLNAHESDSSDFSGDDLSPAVFNSRPSESLGNFLVKGRPSTEDDDTSSIVSQSVDQVLKTPTMAIPATRRTGDGNNRRSAILEIESDRPLTRPTSSRSLRSALNGRALSVSHKRHHSRAQYIRSLKSHHDDRAPFQRRLGEDFPGSTRLHAFHRDNIIDPDLAQYLSDDASSADEQPNLFSVAFDNALSKSAGESEKATFGGFLAAVKKGRSRFGDKSGHGVYSGRDLDDGSVTSSRAVNLGRSTRRRNLSVASSVHQRLSPRPSKENPSIVHYFQDQTIPTLSGGPVSGPGGFKMTRSSSMRGAGAPPVELNRASLQHVRKLLRQLLRDASVPHSHSWETALLPILLKATDDVEPDVQHGDDMDIRHYVKLKKIPGGRPGDTCYVSGLVFTKNLALKSMSRSIPRPNILIVAFPLEYARQQQQFMSLEPVIRQEREFLENLVGRISALRPNVLLVEKNVSGLALQLLEKAGIATAYNVKPSVIEAVSRCTQTKIITSMDRLVAAPAYPGQCGSFDVKTYVHSGRKKTYMYISGCPKELGCTIVLRGASNDALVKIKRITEFMVYVVYNLKLETCLMRDEFAKIPTTSPQENIPLIKDGTSVSRTVNREYSRIGHGEGVDSETSPSEKDRKQDLQNDEPDDLVRASLESSDAKVYVSQDTPAPAFYEDMVEKHQTKILSASPFVRFQQPYLLMRARELERQLAYLKRLRDQDFASNTTSDDSGRSQKFVLITPEMIHESPSGASEKVKEVLHAVHDAEYDRALYNYKTQKRQWETYISGNSNLFDPYAHQNIVVLYSLVCTTTSIPCSGPDLFALDFYNDHGADRIFEADCTLGQYVEDLCHNANTVCTANGCEKPMFDHHQQYVHGDAQVSIFVQPYPSKLRGLQDTILMWSCCKICGNETPAMPMSESTWKYSLGKYLELSFSSADLQIRAGVCPHDMHRDHLRFFGYKEIALRIHYDPITLLEIIVPRPRVTWKVDKDLRLRNEIFTKAEQRLTRFMNSVKARLRGINVDSVVPEMAQSCRKEVDALMKRANDEHAALIKQHQEMYMNSRYWETIPLNHVLLSMQEKVVEWDATFAEFERDYFPSEKDIKRLAALQLKRIFLDKDVSVTSLTSGDENAATPAERKEPGTESTSAPSMARRMTLSPQQAKSVLASVVEEHSGKPNKHDEDEKQLSPLIAAEAGAAVLPETPVISQNEVQHLDLAIPTSLAERLPPPIGKSDQAGFPEQNYDASTPPIDEVVVEDEDSLETKSSPPLNELLDKKMNYNISAPLNQTVSKTRLSSIPRPLPEKSFRRAFRARSPPLLRAQSQPTHIQKEKNSAGRVSPVNIERNNSSTRQDDSFSVQNEEAKAKRGEKRLSKRLGLSSLKPAKLSAGHSLIPRSIPKKHNSKVSSLARHFEQLSREFEKERQRERKQRTAQGKQSRAYPMASSNPVMEVYQSVKDAVDPSDEDFLSNLPSATPPKESTALTDEIEKQRALPVEQPKKSDGQQPETEPRPSQESLREGSHPPSEAEGDGDGEQSECEKCLLEEFHSVEDANNIPAEEIALELKELPKHERSSLVKMLANFWAERSASGWAPLDYPLSDSDHVFADCDIIVREDEPSSLIAFALDSRDYKQKLRSLQETSEKVQTDVSNDSEIPDTHPEVEQSLLQSTGTHLKYQFQEGNAQMLCKIFYAEQFDALRRKCGVSERIVESLSRCMKWDSKGGKTKSLFLKTLDERFILKSLSTVETQAFLKFAPAYFQILSEALFHELPSAIAKMFGFYQVIIKNPATGVEFNWFLLLMENLFYDRNPTRIFDLKGSMRNRKVQSTGEQNEVLLDENMVEFIYESPLFTREHSKKLLSQSVWNDTLFLARQNVMDYSLMIAIDEARQELVVGIIDCIRTYTWDKKLESWIKDRGFAGGGKNRPTVTSPKEYKNRFREAMARYVLHAPNPWHQFQIPNLSKPVLNGPDGKQENGSGNIPADANSNASAS